MIKTYSISIEEKVWNKFTALCKKHGLKMSTRIEVLIQKDLDNKRWLDDGKNKKL